MQLSAPTAFAPTRLTTTPAIVPPTQLFAIASSRFLRSVETLVVDNPAFLPDAMLVEDAIRDAEAGVGILRSAMVPTTPFAYRQRAASAMHSALDAIKLLQSYQNIVAPKGDGLIPRERVSLEAAARLDLARDDLATAMASIA